MRLHDDESLRLSRIEGSMTAEEEGALWFARSSVSSPCYLHPMSVLTHLLSTPLLSLSR